jgi:serine protease AprX
VPNSFVDTNHPEGRLDTRYVRGSGTSEATAVVAGAVALVLQKYPTMSPDLVKRFFQTNAQKLASFDTQAQGAGEIRLSAMANATPQWSYTGQRFTNATGTGSLERSRGQDHLTRNGVVLTGEQDIFGKPVDTSALAAAEAAAARSGGDWNGSSWSGSSGSEAAGRAAPGRGSSWSGSSWSGSSWSGSSWKLGSGSSWSGSQWSGSSWASDSGAEPVKPAPVWA